MKVNSLKQLYLEELKDAYDAEKQIVKALPKMIKAASAPKLQEALESHLEETKIRLNALSRFSRAWASLQRRRSVTV